MKIDWTRAGCLAAVLAAATPIACAPVQVDSGTQNADERPVHIRVFRQDRLGTVDAATADAAMAYARGESHDSTAYHELFEQVTLPFSTDAAVLRGPAAELFDGGWLELYSFYDGIDGTNDGVHRESDEDYRAAVVVELPERASLDEPAGGSEIEPLPGSADFERLQLLYHFGKVAAYLESVGFDVGDSAPSPVYYQPGGGVWRRGHYLRPQLEAVSNNAYFDGVLGFFWITEADPLFSRPWGHTEPFVPVYYRYAVIAHEYGHRVIDAIVDLDRETNRAGGALTARGNHVYGSLHEGVADVLAAAATGGPDILGVPSRDLSVPKLQTEQLEATLEMTDEQVDWDDLPGEHARGAVLAHALWRAGSSDPDRLAAWMLEALRALRRAVDIDPVPSYPMVLELLAATVPPDWLPDLCTALDDTRLTAFHGTPPSCELP